jgi:hypothetical protein
LCFWLSLWWCTLNFQFTSRLNSCRQWWQRELFSDI